MYETQLSLSACLLMASFAPAASIVSLNLPGAGNYASPTVVTTSQSVGAATFDISYTVAAVSNDTGAVVGVSGSSIGVGSDNDVNPQHFNTLEGDGSGGANESTAGGEGLSFTNLSITNFQSNGSGITVGDISDLQFHGLTVGAAANAQDGATISFTGFGTSTTDVNLSGVSAGYTIPLTGLSNFSSTATGLYVQPDNGSSRNRWNVTGLSVSYVPEPSAAALLGLGVVGLIGHRRRS